MSDKRDEISLKDAAQYVPKALEADLKHRDQKITEAVAVLEAMLAASRHGKVVRGS